MSKYDLMRRLEEMPSQMGEVTDDEWWNRLIKDRIDAVAEIKRLVRSRNKWADKYTKMLFKRRAAAVAFDHLKAEVERLMNGQHDTYAAAREEYRKKIDEQAKEIERLTLNGIHTCSDECQRPLCVARRENARLREALAHVQDEANTVCGEWRETASMIDSIARAALKEASNNE